MLQLHIDLDHLRRTRRFFPSGSRDHHQYSLRLPTKGWPGWVGLDGFGCIVPRWYTRERSPIRLLTGPGVEESRLIETNALPPQTATFFTGYFKMLVMFCQCFCLSVVTNLFILFVHVGTTGRYHNESLDSYWQLFYHTTALKIVISIYSLIIVLSCALSCPLNEYVMLSTQCGAEIK